MTKISIRFYNDREVRIVKVERMRKFTNCAIDTISARSMQLIDYKCLYFNA